MQKFHSDRPEKTKTIGKQLAEDYGFNHLYCLFGSLAAGKTILVKGMAKALSVERTIVSPTYVFLRRYQGKTALFHLDLFRIQSSQEFIEAGLEEYLLKEEGLVAIEWADRIKEILPEQRIDVEISIEGEGRRLITVSSRS